MIKTLAIQNYRNLVDLQLQSLGRVNLITGKNNTGKSALLEAISIYTTQMSVNWILSLLEDRGEHYNLRRDDTDNLLEKNLKTFSSLFHGRKTSFLNPDNIIRIGQLDDTLFGKELSKDFVSLRIVKFIEDTKKQPDPEDAGSTIMLRKREIIEKKEDESPEAQIGLRCQVQNEHTIIPLDSDSPFRIYRYKRDNFSENTRFIKTGSIEDRLNANLWDNIALTPKEESVIQALKIIDPTIERIAFVNNPTILRQERTPVIKLEGQSDIIPLRSMGDGINRILTIILALINSDNGYLLIDEFENGLHYTVQQKLWEVIFHLVYEFNIQVFATTHSLDCIRTFENVVNTKDSYKENKLIRLDIVNGLVKHIQYDANELKVATEQGIETR